MLFRAGEKPSSGIQIDCAKSSKGKKRTLDELEVQEQEEEQEDSVAADARRDMGIGGDSTTTRTLYLHGIETLTEEELWRGLRIRVQGKWIQAFDLDAIEAQSYTRNPADLRGTGTAYVKFKDVETRNACAGMWNKMRITDRVGNINVLATEDSAHDLFVPRKRNNSLAARPAEEALTIPRECKQVVYLESEPRIKNARKLEAAMINEERLSHGRPFGRGNWHPKMRTVLIEMGNCVYCGRPGHRQWDCPEADDDGALKCGVCGRRNHATEDCRYRGERDVKRW